MVSIIAETVQCIAERLGDIDYGSITRESSDHSKSTLAFEAEQDDYQLYQTVYRVQEALMDHNYDELLNALTKISTFKGCESDLDNDIVQLQQIALYRSKQLISDRSAHPVCTISIMLRLQAICLEASLDEIVEQLLANKTTPYDAKLLSFLRKDLKHADDFLDTVCSALEQKATKDQLLAIALELENSGAPRQSLRLLKLWLNGQAKERSDLFQALSQFFVIQTVPLSTEWINEIKGHFGLGEQPPEIHAAWLAPLFPEWRPTSCVPDPELLPAYVPTDVARIHRFMKT